MLTYSLRNVVVLTTFTLTSIDYFRQFVVILHGWFSFGHNVLSVLGLMAAVMCGSLTTHALLSLWHGTSFIKDLVDYEPDPIYAN